MNDIRRTTHYDPVERTFTFVTAQNVDAVLDENKRLQNTPQRGDWRHTSTIPNVIYDKWLNEEWERGNRITSIFSEEFAKVVQRKLADPDWRYLRTDNPSNPFYVGWRG